MTDGGSDSLKALANFWSAQGTAMLEAQQTMARSMTKGLQNMFGAGSTTAAPDLSPPDQSKTAEAMAGLWAAASGLSTDLADRLPQAIADPRQWMAGSGIMDDVLAGVADAPRLADLFDLERRSAGIMRRWTELRQRGLDHQQLVLQTWMQAGQAYSVALTERTTADDAALEPKQAMALWTEIANRAMVALQRSEPYLLSQRAVMRASTELRLAQNELSEHIGEQFGFPTRTEVDDVHRSLTEMRRELRRTRRELETLKTATAPPTPIPVFDTIPAKSAKRKKR